MAQTAGFSHMSLPVIPRERYLAMSSPKSLIIIWNLNCSHAGQACECAGMLTLFAITRPFLILNVLSGNRAAVFIVSALWRCYFRGITGATSHAYCNRSRVHVDEVAVGAQPKT